MNRDISRRVFLEVAALAAAMTAADPKVALAEDASSAPPEAEPSEKHVVLVKDMHVAGTMHIAGIDDLVAGLEVGEPLAFVREPNNPHDELAIRVYACDERLGYVPRKKNEILARLMDSGASIGAEITGIEKLGRWNKIHMEVYLGG